jgi:uncharacterized membrane protein
MSDEVKDSLFIVKYAGKDTADEVYDVVRDLEKNKLRDVDIKTAATVYRKDNGKLKLKHKRRVTVWKGMAGGAALGFIVGGPAAVAGTALAGMLIGSSRSGDRKDAKEFLEDKLGADDSALVILVEDADWEALYEATKSYGGEDLKVELTEDAQKQIAELSEDDKVKAQVAEAVEVEEEAPE